MEVTKLITRGKNYINPKSSFVSTILKRECEERKMINQLVKDTASFNHKELPGKTITWDDALSLSKDIKIKVHIQQIDEMTRVTKEIRELLGISPSEKIINVNVI